MPAWLIWTIAALVAWALLSLVVGLLFGHVFQQLATTYPPLIQINEEAELADWSAAPLTRASAKPERLPEPISRSPAAHAK